MTSTKRDEICRLSMTARCSICQRSLENDSEAFGGVTRSGAAAYVGSCCQAWIAELVLIGFPKVRANIARARHEKIGLDQTRYSEDEIRNIVAGCCSHPQDNI